MRPELDPQELLLQEIQLQMNKATDPERGFAFLEGKIEYFSGTYDAYVSRVVSEMDHPFRDELIDVWKARGTGRSHDKDAFLLPRISHHLVRMLHRDRTGTEKQFARDVITHGPSLFAALAQDVVANANTRNCLGGESANVGLWWVAAPYIHEALTKQQAMPAHDSIRALLNWAARSPEPRDYIQVTLPHAERIPFGLYTFVLSLEADENRWSHTTATSIGSISFAFRKVAFWTDYGLIIYPHIAKIAPIASIAVNWYPVWSKNN